MIAANTTMLHFFAGINPYSIAKAPYRAIFLNKMDICASEIGICINREGIITLLPSASAYVGADILAGIAAIDFHRKNELLCFYRHWYQWRNSGLYQRVKWWLHQQQLAQL